MALCTEVDIKTLLGITIAAGAADSMIAQGDAAIVEYCGQELEETAGASVTLEANPNETWVFIPRHPVTAVASVVEDGDTLTVDEDYRWYPAGQLRRTSGSYDWYWSSLIDAIAVTYTTGWATIPDDLVLASATVAGALYQRSLVSAADGAKPVKQIALDGSDSVSYDTTGAAAATAETIPASVKTLLAPYVLRRI